MIKLLDCLLDGISNMVSELRLDNICPYFGGKYTKKVNIAILDYFDGFSANMWAKYYPISVLSRVWNPLIKAIILDPQYERGVKVFLLHLVFSIFYLVCEPK